MNLLPSHSPGRARLVLAVGFGGMLLLQVILGGYAAGALERAHKANSESTRAYLARREALASLRTYAFAVGSEVRNYLLDPDEDGYRSHRQPARQNWQRAQDSLRAYRRAVSDPQRPALVQLDKDLSAYWQLAERGLQMTGMTRRQTGYELLADKLGPGREQFLATIGQLTSEDQMALRGTISETSAFLQRLQHQLWLVMGVSFLFGTLLVAFTYRHLTRLEREAAIRYRHSLDAAKQSEQLSHRLLAVQEDERKLLSRELHDDVGQSVGALLVDLGQARKANSAAEAQRHLQSAFELGERTLQSLRDICLVLRPSMLDDLGLIPALHWQARETSRRTGMLVSVRSDNDELDLDEERRTTVYRVVQEALQNAARHSQAKHVEVALASSAGHLRILIHDDGIGFDPTRTLGLGLLGMQERVARVAGRIRIQSAARQGATLTIDLPIDRLEGDRV